METCSNCFAECPAEELDNQQGLCYQCQEALDEWERDKDRPPVSAEELIHAIELKVKILEDITTKLGTSKS